MNRLYRQYALLFLCVLPLSACARCAPSKVGHGVARLTVRNIGAVGSLINADTRCGFESEDVKNAVVIGGAAGTDGTATWTVSQCELSFSPEDPFISEDCNGNRTIISGRVVVDARRIVVGQVTGLTDPPVVPAGPDAVRIELTNIQFDNFQAQSSVSPNVLTWKQGGISAVMLPRLAVDSEQGACSISTRNVKFESISYQPSTVFVETDSRRFNVDVDSSSLFGVNGEHSGLENQLSGEITVWGQFEPIDGGVDGLDPDYERTLHYSSFACTEGLAQPLSFDCGDFLAPRLAQNAARLSIRVLGRLAHALEQDTKCGFTSPAAIANTQLQGEVGAIGAALTTVDHCLIDFGEESLIKADCDGVETLGRGRVVLSGTKRIEGRLTGDSSTPVIPMSDAPATITIDVIAFDELEIEESGANFVLHEGTMQGKLQPRVAQDRDQQGACGFTTSIARLSEIGYGNDTRATIHSDQGIFRINLGASDMTAVQGSWNGDENLLTGHITVDGESWPLPTDPMDTGLNPDYEPVSFAQSWQCGSLVLPVSHQCEFAAPLAQGAAQLSVQMVGTLAKLADANPECGFSSLAVAANPTITGELGRRGGVGVFEIGEPCRLDFGEGVEVGRDCNGKATYASGVAYVGGTKTIEGVVSGDPEAPILPTSRYPAELAISARLENFAVWSDPQDKILTARSGRLSGVLAPQTGIDPNLGVCSTTTPVAEISGIRWEQADLSIYNGGLNFDIDVPRASLEATNGNGPTRTNYLGGSIVVDGTEFTIPVNGLPELDPDFDQATFDASYACTPDFIPVQSEEQCDLYQLLGENVARLIAMSAGVVASEINGNDDCGFETFGVKTDPDRVVGESGDMGELEWNIEGCRLNRSGASAAQNPVSIDCYARERYLQGDLRVDAQRIVQGRRKTEFLIFDSIDPVTHNAVQITLSNTSLTDYGLWEVEPGETAPLRGMYIPNGVLGGKVEPITGERADDPGIFDVATPVARMSNLSLQNADVTVVSGAKTLKLHIADSDISAFNGSFIDLGITNELGGSITVDGVVVNLGGPLDPAYTQAEFDARYVCAGELKDPIQPAP